ncbi:transcription regulation protein [Paucilactobacillus oligofermentans DSM 15707 = LMG 22743]|uniref:Transcription regulation protein n=1 Tax=Paucilactobacillus oligofermentans DSM 15707 = LMG 22743 TaxID=1423778 RepID=A0A0R1RVA2_9LACO|nr:helix-turn-helix domain-containing protein [Paucilactobacillus oligofermentans]KRL57957.1 transcription regulation protein [Paucilactobacillus oligofermentans DSM 15707 = LMG 22743]CUS26571.1 Putative transcriptional regulator [Paucilactobacillus oligofermentans DSM 15707 = LMG 22743]
MDNKELGQIGRKLRDARVAKGLTLDDLQQTTKIQKRYLIAIEDEKFDELPGDFYVRAFIKQYAEKVGLDGENLLQEFNEQLPDVHTAEYEEKITENQPTRSSKTKTASGLDNLRQYIPTVIVVVIVVAILGAIWLTAIHSRSSEKSTNADSSSVSVSSDSTKKYSSSAKKASSDKEKSSTSSLKVSSTSLTTSAATFNVTGKSSKGYTLNLGATEQSWLQVTSNGSTLYSGTLESGDSKNVKVDSSATSIVLSVGNGDGTKVKLNGKTLDITDSGKYPNVRTVTIKLNGTSSSSSN